MIDDLVLCCCRLFVSVAPLANQSSPLPGRVGGSSWRRRKCLALVHVTSLLFPLRQGFVHEDDLAMSTANRVSGLVLFPHLIHPPSLVSDMSLGSFPSSTHTHGGPGVWPGWLWLPPKCVADWPGRGKHPSHAAALGSSATWRICHPPVRPVK